MILTIHEIEYHELTSLRTIYKYVIELNDYVIISVCFYYKLTKEDFKLRLVSLLEKELLKDPNISNRFVFDWSYIPPDTKHNKYSCKLDDTYIKDLLLEKKMKDIEKDFS